MYAYADNLYEWDMSSYPPTGGFEWINADLTNLGDPCSEDDQGFILEVDIEYLKELHDYHNDYSLAPETVQLNKVKNLVPNLGDKLRYVVHYVNLKQYLRCHHLL